MMKFISGARPTPKSPHSFQCGFSGLLRICLIGLSGLLLVHGVEAQVDVEIVASPKIIVDSNVLSPSTYAPETITVQVKYYQNTGTAINDVYAHIGNIDGSGATAATLGISAVPSTLRVTLKVSAPVGTIASRGDTMQVLIDEFVDKDWGGTPSESVQSPLNLAARNSL